MQDFKATIQDHLPRVRDRLVRALAAEGFGVLTQIDLQATLDEKLGVAHEAHHILGVCRPQLAHQALEIDRGVALLLPCSVTLRDVAGATEVRILDPEQAFLLADEPTREQLQPLARDARHRLAAALAATVGEGVGS